MSFIAVEMGRGGVCIMASVFVVGILYSVFRLYMSCRNAPGVELYYAFCIRGPHFVVCIQRDSYYVLVPRVQSKEDQVRLVAPTQMALCLRPCLLPTLKGESCYAPSEPSMTRLHNEELVK